MRILAPEGTLSISHGGENVEIVDGACDVSSATAAHLCDSFGFTVEGAKQADPKMPDDKFSNMSRAEVIGYIKGKGLPVIPSSETEKLRAVARAQYSPEERAEDDRLAAEARKS
jgi:hypothetical protein